MSDTIRIQRDDKILTVTLDRPEKLNALRAEDCHELARIWEEYSADDSLRVAIVTGSGRAFCAGHDLHDDITNPMPESGWAGLARRTGMDKPLIAAVNGLAFGGGFELVLACDIVFASEEAKFALPEPRVGLVAFGGGAVALPRRIPSQVAMRYLLSGETMDCQTAHQWGLVSEITRPRDVLSAAKACAKQILLGGPAAVRATKALAQASMQADAHKRDLDRLSAEYMQSIIATEDAREGEAAFRERRRPRWTGR